MSVPGISCVMSSYLPQAEKRVGFTICLCLTFLCHVVLLIAKRTRGVLCHVLLFIAGGGFYRCLYLACCPSTYRKVKTGWFSHMCVPGFPLVVFLLFKR